MKEAFRLTGVDLDGSALEARGYEKDDLAEASCGDLRTVDLPEKRYNVIYSSFGHVSDTTQVLERFGRWLKPRDIIILRIPDRDGMHGFVTRKTPFWFQVHYDRFVRQKENGGKSGLDRYQTVRDKIVSQRGIHEVCSPARSDNSGRTQAGRIFGGNDHVGRILNKFTNLTYVPGKPR